MQFWVGLLLAPTAAGSGRMCKRNPGDDNRALVPQSGCYSHCRVIFYEQSGRIRHNQRLCQIFYRKLQQRHKSNDRVVFARGKPSEITGSTSQFTIQAVKLVK